MYDMPNDLAAANDQYVKNKNLYSACAISSTRLSTSDFGKRTN